jgi:hypothetical protein
LSVVCRIQLVGVQHPVLAVILLDVVEDVFRFLGRWVGGRVSPISKEMVSWGGASAQ